MRKHLRRQRIEGENICQLLTRLSTSDVRIDYALSRQEKVPDLVLAEHNVQPPALEVVVQKFHDVGHVL